MRSIIVPLLAVASLVAAGCNKTPAEHKPETAIVTTERARALDSADLSASAPEYIATIRADQETDLSFKVGGILELIGPEPRRDWEEGTAVKTEVVLSRLQQADFRNALASAKAAAELATSNNERLKKLLEKNVVSKQEVDKARADTETAQAQLRQAEQNLRDSELRAPWAGMILARFVNNGESVPAGKPVLRFGNTDVMQVELGVPDRLVGLFVVDKEIDVDISALAGRPPFRGKITEVGVAASNAGRLYRVVIKVPNAEGIIKSGMTATVKAGGVAATAPGQVLVPLSALITPPGDGAGKNKSQAQLAVFVVKDGKASLRPVKTGDIVASSIIVTEGLNADEEVVTRGASQLYDGAPVGVR